MHVTDLIRRPEGFKQRVYCDRCGQDVVRSQSWWECRCGRLNEIPGNLTVGIGSRIDGPGITESEAVAMSWTRIQALHEALDSNQLFGTLGEVRQAALIDMAYNMGVEAVFSFHDMWAAISRRDFQAAADAMLRSRWAHEVAIRAAHDSYMMRTGNWPTEIV